MRLILAILLGKVIFFLTRVFKIGGGSAAPGLYALKIDPELVTKLSQKIPTNIIITGTNGKTTTSRLLAHFITSQNLKVLRNSTGSNLERGIASTLISRASLDGKISNINAAIWETDEAAFNTVLKKIKPQIIVFLNLFRDQLDRYGEVNSVLEKWLESLKDVNENTLVLINGDDNNTSKIASKIKAKVELFGLKDFKIRGERLVKEKEDEELDYEAKNIKTKGLDGVSFQLTTNNEQLTINLPLPGIYHIYDFLAAFAVSFNLNLDAKKMIGSLQGFSPAFGRVEKFEMTHPVWEAKKSGYIFLIKNPAGATQVFETIKDEIDKRDVLLMALNDNFADGRDVSWIWDADFEEFKIQNSEFKIICSGSRAYDLAVRLKYAGIEPSKIKVLTNLEQAFREAKRGLEGQLYILPTYTAMLNLQRLLVKHKIKKHYWEEN